jgi:hypothetical protein
MACPYFEPLEPNRGVSRAEDSMLPLGGCWTGVCRSDPGAPFRPSAQTLRALCNLGYARQSCTRFPAGAEGDAVRFTVAADYGLGLIRLYHVVERDHLPLCHGALVYSAPAGSIDGASSPAVASLALAYVRSYLHRKALVSSR